MKGDVFKEKDEEWDENRMEQREGEGYVDDDGEKKRENERVNGEGEEKGGESGDEWRGWSD